MAHKPKPRVNNAHLYYPHLRHEDWWIPNQCSQFRRKCLTFLRRYCLYSKNSLPCTGKGGLVYGSNMVLTTRLVKGWKLPYFRCGVAKCRASKYEAYFGGKAKYEKGRRLQYDRQSQEPDPNEFITEVLSEMAKMKEKKRMIYRRSMDLGCSKYIRMPCFR